VAGGTLRAALRAAVESGEAWPYDRVARLLRDVASALAYAHDRRVVHRDVKPENIFLGADGRALLGDFGIARRLGPDAVPTLVGSAAGTPAYMAPEQVAGLAEDERTDVYALGLVGWELLTGRRPWQGETLYAVLHKQQHEILPALAPLRPDIPAFLLAAVEGALAKDAGGRWRDGAEFLRRLTPTPTQLPPIVSAPEADVGGATVQFAKPRRPRVATAARGSWAATRRFAAGAIGIAAVLAVAAFWPEERAPRPTLYAGDLEPRAAAASPAGEREAGWRRAAVGAAGRLVRASTTPAGAPHVARDAAAGVVVSGAAARSVRSARPPAAARPAEARPAAARATAPRTPAARASTEGAAAGRAAAARTAAARSAAARAAAARAAARATARPVAGPAPAGAPPTAPSARATSAGAASDAATREGTARAGATPAARPSVPPPRPSAGAPVRATEHAAEHATVRAAPPASAGASATRTAAGAELASRARAADARMSAAYGALLDAMRRSAGGRREPRAARALRDEQQRWVARRDRECRARGDGAGGGAQTECRLAMTRARATALAERRARFGGGAGDGRPGADAPP
jgi:uncharacterized protein YecT (DUF1311 family)